MGRVKAKRKPSPPSKGIVGFRNEVHYSRVISTDTGEKTSEQWMVANFGETEWGGHDGKKRKEVKYANGEVPGVLRVTVEGTKRDLVNTAFDQAVRALGFHVRRSDDRGKAKKQKTKR